MRKIFYLFFSCLLGLHVVAQTDLEAGRAALIGVSADYQMAAGDWTDQYNDLFIVGTEFGWKFSKNYLLLAQGGFGFGGPVNRPGEVLGPILTDNNQVLNLNGNYATVTLYQRLAYASFQAEKLLNFWKANGNSGPVIGLGGGYIWHWIRLDNAGNDSPQINDKYRRGYDRLSRGFMSRQSIGYLYLSSNRRINFKITFEFNQLFTQNIRGYNYATGQFLEGIQNNYSYGLKLTWYLPIYQGGKTQEYYYD